MSELPSEPTKALSLDEAQKLIAETCDELKAMLLEKNKSYNNSVLNPHRIFSRAKSSELIRVRADDKISRIAKGEKAFGEDACWDLAGYLILLRIAEKLGR